MSLNLIMSMSSSSTFFSWPLSSIMSLSGVLSISLIDCSLELWRMGDCKIREYTSPLLRWTMIARFRYQMHSWRIKRILNNCLSALPIMRATILAMRLVKIIRFN
ncbi:unnamed protein product [Nesidiocoris tenuis]|uniref:Uncharacterized protein n=1 Tax=Nesidiocoris tenuis TaxID=355587 RepID=A0A6H5G0A4_9HEMI|nr:unnamed protein product [Nesidiocoris tenuis]